MVLQQAHESSRGRERGHIFSDWSDCFNREEPAFLGWQRPAAIMVILVQNPEPAVLLIQRPDNLTHHAGQIACPGGSFDPRWDQTLWDTARRETREEVGIDVPTDARAGYLDEVYITVTGFTLVPAVTLMGDRPRVIPDSGEVADYHWVALSELTRTRRMSRWVADGVSYRMPEFPLTWGRLWGATAKVMDDLLSRGISPLISGMQGGDLG